MERRYHCNSCGSDITETGLCESVNCLKNDKTNEHKEDIMYDVELILEDIGCNILGKKEIEIDKEMLEFLWEYLENFQVEDLKDNHFLYSRVVEYLYD